MRLVLSLIFLLPCLEMMAQVGEVKERARSYKESSSDDDGGGTSKVDSDGDVGSFIAWELFKLPFYGLYMGQMHQLDKAPEQPWRISLEANFLASADLANNSYLVQPWIRGNWGLGSTQLRFTRLLDNTGTLTTWDWQILQFNLVNTEFVRLTAGYGLSHEVGIDQTHGEFASELAVFLADRKWAPTIAYRSSGDGTPRREFSSQLEYRRVHTTPPQSFRVGYTHQSWYGLPFNYLTAGVGFFLE